MKSGDIIWFPLVLSLPRASCASALSFAALTQLFHCADEARWHVFSS
eukprot:SAG25_NODE_13765_length_263_cov_0.634146_2_plen_46_part_01